MSLQLENSMLMDDEFNNKSNTRNRDLNGLYIHKNRMFGQESKDNKI